MQERISWEPPLRNNEKSTFMKSNQMQTSKARKKLNMSKNTKKCIRRDLFCNIFWTDVIKSSLIQEWF